MRLALLSLVACPKLVVPQPVPPPPADVPIPREGGPIAGPRYVVDAAPPPPVPESVPGQGPIGPYLELLRRDLVDRMADCTDVKVGNGAILHLALATDGTPAVQFLARSSGDAAWDACVLDSVARGPFEAPPFELLGSEPTLAVDLAFR